MYSVCDVVRDAQGQLDKEMDPYATMLRWPKRIRWISQLVGLDQTLQR
jgi:hypothetical protein